MRRRAVAVAMHMAVPHGNRDGQGCIEIIVVGGVVSVLAEVRVVMQARVVPVLRRPGPMDVFVSVVIDTLRQRYRLIRSVSMAMRVGIAMATSTPAQVEPSGKSDPCAEPDKRQGGRRIDDLPGQLRG